MTEQRFRTAKGSDVVLHASGSWKIAWDWVEDGGCFDCSPVDVTRDGKDAMLTISCPSCGETNIRAKLVKP